MVGACAGIVLFCPDREIGAEDLFIAADIALYDAKDAGHGGIRIYRGQKGMQADLGRADSRGAERGPPRPHAQPIVDLRSGEVAREELLVRMIDRDGCEIPPRSFLPTAERFGLIGEIDRFAVEPGDRAGPARAVPSPSTSPAPP